MNVSVAVPQDTQVLNQAPETDSRTVNGSIVGDTVAVRRRLLVERYEYETARIHDLLDRGTTDDRLQAEEIACDLHNYLRSQCDVVRAGILLDYLEDLFVRETFRSPLLSRYEYWAREVDDDYYDVDGVNTFDDGDWSDDDDICYCRACITARMYGQ
jgi:hypothetical protein